MFQVWSKLTNKLTTKCGDSVERLFLVAIFVSLSSLDFAQRLHGKQIIEVRLLCHLIEAYNLEDVANTEALVPFKYCKES